jgi:hypothetical protein
VPYSPESFPPSNAKHIRVLENRINYLIGMNATKKLSGFQMAELGALCSVVADVKEIVAKREADQALPG